MLSNMIYKETTSHSGILDVWESILYQLKQIVPSGKEAAIHEQSSLERKRKLGSEDTIPIKKRKLDGGSPVVVQCLLNLLNNLLMELNFLDPQHQLSARKRQDTLLQELHDLISDLGVYTMKARCDLSAQYFQLITILGQCQIVMYKYGFRKKALTSADIQNMFVKWEIPLDNPSFYTSYYWRKWLCFKLEWIAWQLKDDSISQEDQENLQKSFNAIFSSLLKLVMNNKTSDTHSVWNGLPENISSSETLNVATLHLLKSVFHISLSLSDDNSISALSNILVNYNKDSKQADGITSKSVICDLLLSSSFAECKRLHSSLLKRCVEQIEHVLSESKLKKGAFRNVLQFAKLCTTSTEDVNCMAVSKSVAILFDKDLQKPKELQDTMNHIVDVIQYLPLNYLPINEKCSSLLLLTCSLAAAESDVDLQQKMIKMSDMIIGSQKNKQFSLILPLRIVLPYLTSRNKLYSSEIKLCVRRMLTHLVKLQLNESDLKVETFNQMIPGDASECLDESSLMSLYLLLEHLSTLILRHKKSSLSKYVFSMNCDVTIGSVSNSDTSHYFPDKKHLKGITQSPVTASIDSKMDDRLGKCADILKKLLLVASSQLKFLSSSSSSSPIYELLRLALIASHTLDIHHQTELDDSFKKRLLTKIDFQSWITKALQTLKESEDYDTLRSKVQLILLITELKVTDSAEVAIFSNMSLCESLKENVCCLIDSYSSNLVKNNFLLKALLDRTIVINLASIPSCKEYCELLDLSLCVLNESDDIDVMMAKLSFVRLIASCYDVKARKFLNINSGNYTVVSGTTDTDASPEKEIHFSLIKFLRGGLDGAIGVVEKVTSSNIDQSPIELLLFVFQTICDVLNLGPNIIKPRQASASIPELRTFDLYEVHLRHRGDFLNFFSAFYEVVNSILVHHKEATVGALPLFISSCRKMLNVTMIIGRQASNVENGADYLMEAALSCTHYLQRMCQFIASHYASYFKRNVGHLLADYAIGLSTDTLYPPVKESLSTAMYHLVALCDENDVALLKATLPPGVREIFRTFYVDYLNYFKYTGHV